MKTLLKHKDSLQMSEGNKYLLSSFRAAAIFVAAISIFAYSALAYDMEAIREDVNRYFSTIHGSQSLEDYYYFCGEERELELEYELQACADLGHAPQSDTCLAYHHCRYFNSADRRSYHLAAESRLFPTTASNAHKTIDVECLGDDHIPNMRVHVKMEGHTYTFDRVTEKNGARVFGKLNLSEIDGKPATLPEIDIMEVLKSDPCRDILLNKQ